jgi:hypothetical protein
MTGCEEHRWSWPWLPWDGRGFPPETLILLLLMGVIVGGLVVWNVAVGVIASIPLGLGFLVGNLVLTMRRPFDGPGGRCPRD